MSDICRMICQSIDKKCYLETDPETKAKKLKLDEISENKIDENLETAAKKIKLEEISDSENTNLETKADESKVEDINEVEKENIEAIPEVVMKKEYSWDELVMRPKKTFQLPIITIGEEHIFEIANLCHSERLAECFKTDFEEIDKQFQPFCNSHCAFDRHGVPRVVFQCDICLVLWHTDCIGHRWVIGDKADKLIICDVSGCSFIQYLLNAIRYSNISYDPHKVSTTSPI